MSLVFLIGMPGVGKTHWGRIWSAAAKFEFIDLDECIVARAGTPIPQIFREHGEIAFRNLESAVLNEVISSAKGRNLLIATGGGTPAFNDNMRAMLDAGCVVYLQADIDRLLQQLSGSATNRPLWDPEKSTAQSLEALLAVRHLFYQQAPISLPVETIHTDTFAEILLQCISRQL